MLPGWCSTAKDLKDKSREAQYFSADAQIARR
jgi:hypothetical protein